MTWTLIKIRLTAPFLMLYPIQDGKICIVTVLQNLQDLLHIPYNSYSVHKHHTAEAFNELKLRINETN